MTAPVCHIPGTQTDPTSPNATVQTIPLAQPNVQSLVNTVNALRNLVMQLANQQPKSNNPFAPIQTNLSGTNGGKKPTWKEQSRVTEKVRVYQNNDKSSPNWVEVEQINSLTMVDNTGQTWRWDRKRR